MNKLIDLVDQISNYNRLGKLRLPVLKIAIFQTQHTADLAQHILKQFSAYQMHSLMDLMGVGGYQSYRTAHLKNCQIFLIDSLYGEQAVEDKDFLRRKKSIQKLRMNKQIIFVYLSAKNQFKEGISDKLEILQLKRVDTCINRDIYWKGNTANLYESIYKTWQTINRFQIITALEDVKGILKDLKKNEKRENQWLLLQKQQMDPSTYALQLHYVLKQYLVSSFSGYYSPQDRNFVNKFSIHWQIMDILQDLWKEQGQRINNELQHMPLSYIHQTIKMNDCSPIGGFIPQSCFLKIFKPILETTADALIMCLQAAKFKIMHNVQQVYDYYFGKTSIKQDLITREMNEIQKMCDNFITEVTNAINSQISYVYAPSQTFWELRNIRSDLYSVEQQANIQIKYIGKVYVKRVFQSIRESIPRYIGQGLLRKISKYIYEQSLQSLLIVMKQIPFKIIITETQKQQIEYKVIKKVQCQKLIKYFSLKVNSTYLLKNLQQKMEKRWKQVYGIQQASANAQSNLQQQNNPKGFFGWMKRLFRSQKKQDQPKRSSSAEKEKSQCNKEQKLIKQDQGPVHSASITEKTWILVLYSNKKVDDSKITLASCEGFPMKLRPNIWYWLSSRRTSEQYKYKLKDILKNKQMDSLVQLQIEKDLGRTPPTKLFKKKYRSSLKRVLSAYSLIDEQIQYTQGMNFIVSAIICTLVHFQIQDQYIVQSSEKVNVPDLQEKAFVILQFLMLRRGFRRIMFIQRQYIAEICFKLQEQIKNLNMKVFSMIEKSGFTCEIIFSPLIISGLLTWSKKIEINKRILDLVLCRGIQVLYKIVAGIAAMSQQQLGKLRHEQIYDFLRNKALDVFYNKFGEVGLTNLFQSF